MKIQKRMSKNQLFLLCEKDANDLKRLNKIQNQILINCSYHEKNKEKKLISMKNAGATKEEIALVIEAYNVKEKLGLRLLNRYKRLIEEVNNDSVETEIEQ